MFREKSQFVNSFCQMFLFTNLYRSLNTYFYVSTSQHNKNTVLGTFKDFYNITEEKVLGSKLLPRIITHQFMLENKQTNITEA